MFVFIKLEEPIGSSMGPNFEVVANVGTVVPNIFTAAQLTDGVLVEVDNSATFITVNSGEPCNRILNIKIVDLVNFFGTTTSTTTIVPCSQAICGQTYEGYGYLYNWFVIGDDNGRADGGIVNKLQPVPPDERNEWRVPTDQDWTDFENYIGSNNPSVGSSKIRTTCFLPFTTGNGLWQSPNTGATNELNWSAVPGGYRNPGITTGNNFTGINFTTDYWSSSLSLFGTNAWFRSISNFIFRNNAPGKESGRYLRLVRPATQAEQGLTDGTTSNQNSLLPHYVGNSRTYITVKIGNRVWTAQNLIDEEYNDGTPIPEVTDTPTWNGLTTGARCSYNNGIITPNQGQIELCGVAD